MIAIMRGLTPVDAADHGRVLYEAGFRVIEVPPNSPRPFDSIAAIRQALHFDAIIGAAIQAPDSSYVGYSATGVDRLGRRFHQMVD